MGPVALVPRAVRVSDCVRLRPVALVPRAVRVWPVALVPRAVRVSDYVRLALVPRAVRVWPVALVPRAVRVSDCVRQTSPWLSTRLTAEHPRLRLTTLGLAADTRSLPLTTRLMSLSSTKCPLPKATRPPLVRRKSPPLTTQRAAATCLRVVVPARKSRPHRWHSLTHPYLQCIRLVRRSLGSSPATMLS